mmetsp:Transcript_65954/g.151157  ORF Transcript_65954/g.151157 Transcript_65954/m.151157 type:complete len:96 (+) Transcript_65954:2-289(+)
MARDVDPGVLVEWKEALAPQTWTMTTPKRLQDLNKPPEHDLFEDRAGRPLPCAWLPTVRTSLGELRIYKEEDLIRENAHLTLDGPCPFECACCVM